MKIAILCVILLTGILLPDKKVYSQAQWTPAKAIIIGGVIAGVEVIYGLYQLAFDTGPEKEEEVDLINTDGDTNISQSKELEELEKYEAIEKLISRSKIYDMMQGEPTQDDEEELKLILMRIVQRKPKMKERDLLDEEDDMDMAVAYTQASTVDEKSQEEVKTIVPLEGETGFVDNKPHEDRYDVIPEENQFEFRYKITNSSTGEVFSRSKIDYYQMGKAYFIMGEKTQAKDYFLKTVVIDRSKVNRARSILFLKKEYGMSLDAIIRDVRVYKKLHKKKKK